MYNNTKIIIKGFVSAKLLAGLAGWRKFSAIPPITKPGGGKVGGNATSTIQMR
jgi:hypothetical protein